ncbi:MAG: M1 family aminopeptidase [Bacteroidales bacterium]
MKKASGIILMLFISLHVYAQQAVEAYKSDNDKVLHPAYQQKHRAADDYDVIFYYLDLILDNTSSFVSGTAQIDLQITEPGLSVIELDMVDELSIDEVRVNGSVSSFTHEYDMLSIPLERAKQKSFLTVEVDYAGTPPYGMYNSTDNTLGETTTYSLSEPFDAMGWFPVKQDLTDKADSSRVYITVPENLKAASNGLLTGTSDMGEGQTRYEWESSYPIAYYLISVAVGNYQDYSFYAHPAEIEDSILIQNYIYDYPGYLDYYQDNIDETDDMIEALSSLLGIYPHHEEKYGHAVVKLNGGMEHQTMTSLGYFSFVLVAHELGHSWFGNYLTCASWQDIWINEGFAVYSEYLASQAVRTEAESREWLETNAYNSKEYDDGSVYVPFEDANNVSRIFDYTLSYKKGGMLVHMIRYLLDDDAMFFDVLQTHLDVYADSMATGDDFKNVLEDVSGMDFTDFFNQWYYGEGYPVYDVQWYQANDTLVISTNQTGSCFEAPLFTMPVEYMLHFEDGDSLLIKLPNNAAEEEYIIPEDRTISNIEFDPRLWLMADHSIEQITGIDEQKPACRMYPNPARNRLNIMIGRTADYDIEIRNVQGRLLHQEHFTGNSHSMDISFLSKGVYVFRISSDTNAVKTEKLIVN